VIAQFVYLATSAHVIFLPILFVAMSYPDLWANWSLFPEPVWLPKHVQEVSARYAVALG
jgi:hypothetical protein